MAGLEADVFAENVRAESRSLSASRARQNAAGKTEARDSVRDDTQRSVPEQREDTRCPETAVVTPILESRPCRLAALEQNR